MLTCAIAGAFELNPEDNPSGYTLFVDIKPRKTIAESSWSLSLTCTSELVANIVSTGAQKMAGTYLPNKDYRLCRLVLGATSKCHAAIHVECSAPGALVHAKVITLTAQVDGSQVHEVLADSAVGIGCTTLLAVPLDAPPPPPAKGMDPAPSVTRFLEVCIDRLSAIDLGLGTKPRPKKIDEWSGDEQGSSEQDIRWTVSAIATTTVSLAQDTTREDELTTLISSWEHKAPGRANKAKEARSKYLHDVMSAEEAALNSAVGNAEADATAAAVEEASGGPTNVDPPRVVRKSLQADSAYRLVPDDEVDYWRSEKAGALDVLVSQHEASEAAGADMRERMIQISAHALEAQKVRYADTVNAHDGLASAKQALLSKLSTISAEPVEQPTKAKKK